MNTIKFKVTLVVTKEFEIPTGHYPKGISTADMLKLEKEAFEEEPSMLLEEDADIEVTVEPIRLEALC